MTNGTQHERADQDDDKDLTVPPMEQDELAVLLVSIFGKAPGVWDDGVERTAARVIRFWKEYAGRGNVIDFAFTTFPAHSNQLVICRDIEFSSLCAHHLLPFYGMAHIGYVPNKLQVGLSKIPRLVDFWATRPQVQEQLTEQIAGSLKDALEAMGVAVVIEARHTCMACRGIRTHNGLMVTSNMRGVFLTAEAARQEFLTLIGRRGL
jgi:GTP cyclohydrolase I